MTGTGHYKVYLRQKVVNRQNQNIGKLNDNGLIIMKNLISHHAKTCSEQIGQEKRVTVPSKK